MILRKLYIICCYFFLLTAFLLVPLGTKKVRANEQQQELFLVAEKAFEDGFYDVAIRYITQLLEEQPQTEKRIQANLLLGQCYYFKNQYLKAFDIFQKLLDYSDYKDATLFWLGETYLKGSDYKQAESHYKQLIELYPDSIYTPQSYYSLGWVYFEQDEYDKAKESFQALLRKFPTSQLNEDATFKLGETEYNARQYEKTIEYFKNFILQYPKSTRHAEAYFYMGESYYYLNDQLTAITYYSKAEQISYNNKLTLMSKLSLGWSYLKLKKFDLAEENFNNAKVFAQEKGILSDDVFLGQANLYTELGKPEEALDAYSQLIENFPKSKRLAEAYLGKANTYYLLKNYQMAIDTYKSIIYELESSVHRQEILEKAYFGLAWSNLKAGKIDESIKIFELIKDQTESTTVKISALTQIGDAYQDADELEKAIEIYDSILKEYEDSPYTDYVQYRQGIALLKLGKIETATLSFRTLQANFPESKYLNDVRYYLAVAYYKKSDWINVIDQVNEFLKQPSENTELAAEAKYILALSYYNVRDFSKSLKTFEQIIKNHPEHGSIIANAELNIAKCYFKLDNTSEALKKFRQIISKSPTSEAAQESLIWLGDYYLENSQFDEAIQYYQKFVEQFPGSNKINLVKFELGQIYQVKEEYDKAIAILKTINDSSGRELLAKAQLTIADIFSKDLDADSAINTYRNVISDSPEFKRDAYVKIAAVHKDLGEFTSAIEQYQNALKADQASSNIGNAELQFYISDTFELINDHDKAIEEYFKIPYLYPKDKEWIIKAYLRIARIFEDDEKWEEAKTTYIKIIESNAKESIFAQERIDWITNNTLDTQ